MTGAPPHAEQQIIRAAEIICFPVNGDLMLLNARRATCYALAETGAYLWSLLDTPRSVAELCTLMIAHFAVDTQTCRGEVVAIIDDMMAEGLVGFADGAPA